MHIYIKGEKSFSKKNFKYRSNDGITNYKYSFMLMIALVRFNDGWYK